MILKRVAETAYGTFGVLIDIAPFALTLERMWLENRTGISCIPAGQYHCVRVNSPHFGDTFQIMDVPDRSHILFHKGNLNDDTHGCVLVGEMFGKLEGKDGVLASRHGYNEFMDKLRSLNSFDLKIIDSTEE